ncbi:MAG: phosphotransferase, partial [Bryobacteraceae bacterium]
MKQCRSTTEQGLNRDRVAAFAADYLGKPRAAMQLNFFRLRGGLDSGGVFRVQAEFAAEPRRQWLGSFVVKCTRAQNRRELNTYRELLSDPETALAPRLFGTDYLDSESYLYLEWIDSWRRWPWREAALAGLVLDRLAWAHCSLPAGPFAEILGDWDYEAELSDSSRTTLELFETRAMQKELGQMRRVLPAVRRLVAVLPAVRRQLMSEAGSASVLHGDAHPGNAIIHRNRRSTRAVLLDWGRSRLGSPLEDVSSWLQSLGYWEPEARRRHD